MRIGIDARLYSQTGIGKYTSKLIEKLELLDNNNEYVIFMNEVGKSLYHPKNPRFKKWIVNIRPYSLSEQTTFLIELLRAKLDLIHFVGFNHPIYFRKKKIVTIHDLTMLEYNQKATTKSSAEYFVKNYLGKYVFEKGLQTAYRIITPTESIKREILQSYNYRKPKRIHVINEGVDSKITNIVPRDDTVLRTRLEELHIKGMYLLYVGNAAPHKNLESLVVAYKDLLEKGLFHGQLVIAGPINTFSQKLAGFVHALKLDGNIVFVAKYADKGFLTDKDIAYLYKGAYAYVFPSLKEGFSLTPLEAQLFGVPCLVSDISVHREVFGDSVLYFNPESNIELTENLFKLITNADLREKFKARGLVNSKKYSWETMAMKTLELYKS